MRQEREPQFLVTGDESDDDNESDEDDVDPVANKPPTSNAFAMMSNDDDDSSDESSSSSSSSHHHNDEEDKTTTAPAAKPSASTTDEQVEDLDALLQEYQLKDKQDGRQGYEITASENKSSSNYYSIITAGMDPRDLDIDHVMRSSLMGSGEKVEVSHKSRSSRRGNRQIPIFGPPKDDWPRPPHYVGGGMGMDSYHDLEKTEDESAPPLELPWPYCDMKEKDPRCPPTTQWYQFLFSDSYQRDLYDFETIQASGDANALAMFVAHHPFIVPALLQLSEVLYQTRQNQEGLAMLKRSLWVFECAALNSFLKMDEDDGRNAFMDYSVEENRHFFEALFRLMRVSHVGGLPRTSLAASRFLLSLDPLGDPMNVLLAIDHFALACNSDACDDWLVSFVESNKVGWRGCISHQMVTGITPSSLFFSRCCRCRLRLMTKKTMMFWNVQCWTCPTGHFPMPWHCSGCTTEIPQI
jgi:Transcriptional repressor TCF25